jgi:hypothetical protein
MTRFYVREYFNATGFDRWRRIWYGEGDDANKVQLIFAPTSADY